MNTNIKHLTGVIRRYFRLDECKSPNNWLTDRRTLSSLEPQQLTHKKDILVWLLKTHTDTLETTDELQMKTGGSFSEHRLKIRFFFSYQSRPPSSPLPTSGLWTCLHARLLIPKINSSAHLCPSNTTLTPTTGGILLERNVPLWLHGETSVWPFHLRPSLSTTFPPSTRFQHRPKANRNQPGVISGQKRFKASINVLKKTKTKKTPLVLTPGIWKSA